MHVRPASVLCSEAAWISSTFLGFLPITFTCIALQIGWLNPWLGLESGQSRLWFRKKIDIWLVQKKRRNPDYLARHTTICMLCTLCCLTSRGPFLAAFGCFWLLTWLAFDFISTIAQLMPQLSAEDAGQFGHHFQQPRLRTTESESDQCLNQFRNEP